MSKPGNHMGGKWCVGGGDTLTSINPANDEIVWQGATANDGDVEEAVSSAEGAFEKWSHQPFEDRADIIRKFGALVTSEKDRLASLISEEMGKPLWDSRGEISAVSAKIDLSLRAYGERTGQDEQVTGQVRSSLSHRPLGVLAVFGPFNFPAHLPNGHVVPALLAGNCIVYKPSELTPAIAIEMVRLWEQAGLPSGVLNLVQGSRTTGEALVAQRAINGVLFTGSAATGRMIAQKLADRPEVILALELGGNNPLIVDRVADLNAAAKITLQSAFITSGQRCTCARRLVVPRGDEGDKFLSILAALMEKIRIGGWDEQPEPFMGPMVSKAVASQVFDKYEKMLKAGAVSLRTLTRLGENTAYLSPGLIDVSEMSPREDEEIFGPLHQVIRVENFRAAIEEANTTRFGLAAGLLSDEKEQYESFRGQGRAGILSWNRPLTGASGARPFGGLGASGNHRPGAFYAADYCADPVASLEDIGGTARFDQPLPGMDG